MTELEQIYAESTALIDSAPELKSNQIPDRLINAWYYNGPVIKNPSIEQLLSLAIYNYATQKYGIPAYTVEYDQRRYEMFQYILAIEIACRKSGGRLRPRKIFDFATYDSPVNLDMKAKQADKFRRIARSMHYLKRGV